MRGVALAVVTIASSASAGEPTIEECLSASEQTLVARRAQKLQEARDKALVCASASCPSDVRLECEKRVRDINSAIPTIIFEAKDEAGGDLSAVHVTEGGKLVTNRLDGAPYAFDPGEHTFVFESTTHKDARLERSFVLLEGQKNRRETIVLPGIAAPPPPVIPVVTPPVDAGPQPRPREGGMRPLRVVGLVTAGAGVVMFTVGAVLWANAQSRHDDAIAECPNDVCTPAAYPLQEDAKSLVKAGNVLAIMGGVLALGGLALFVATPSSSKPRALQVAPWTTANGGGIGAAGSF